MRVQSHNVHVHNYVRTSTLAWTRNINTNTDINAYNNLVYAFVLHSVWFTS